MDTYVDPRSDMQMRFRPSDTQIFTAREMLKDYLGQEVAVMVPIALSDKTEGFWTPDVDVDHIEGVYVLAYGGRTPIKGTVDYSMAREIVEWVARANSKNGTGGYAVIHPDGRWAVWEI
jgi:hypothetical protein